MIILLKLLLITVCHCTYTLDGLNYCGADKLGMGSARVTGIARNSAYITGAGVIVICVSPGYVCPQTYITSDIYFPSRLCVP